MAEVVVTHDPRDHMSPEPPSPSWRLFQDMMKARAAGMDLEGCAIVEEERDLRFDECEVHGVVEREVSPLCSVCGSRDCDHVNPVPGCVRVEEERDAFVEVVSTPEGEPSLWKVSFDAFGFAVIIEEEWDVGIQELRGYRADVVQCPDPYAEMDAGWLEWSLVDTKGAVAVEGEYDQE